MNQPDDFRGLLQRSLAALAACVVLVVVCYLWVDRPVAFYVHDHQVESFRVFKWLTYPPPLVQTWSPLVLALLAVRLAWGPLARWQKTLAVACLSLIVADQFRSSLGDVCGRYWPETWFDNNPSLIGTGTYGFHPFESGDDIGSFPSGHASRILAFAMVWWIAMPRGRGLWIAVCLPMLVSLVAMNYHFVGDVLAGGCLGGIVGAYAARIANLEALGRSSPPPVSRHRGW
jgi:membrane-associated phospholipid phosphatase